MEPISFTLEDLYFVIDPFKFSVVNRVVTVVKDPVPISRDMRDVHQKINNFLDKIRLHQFNSLKVHNLNAKISLKSCLVVFGSYL